MEMHERKKVENQNTKRIEKKLKKYEKYRRKKNGKKAKNEIKKKQRIE